GTDVSVWNVENLTVGGSGGSDTFTVQAVPTFGVNLKGDVGNDTLIGPDRTNAWAITANNLGTLDKTVAFNSVENLTGGSGSDNYAFSSARGISGQLDGGGGTN